MFTAKPGKPGFVFHTHFINPSIFTFLVALHK